MKSLVVGMGIGQLYKAVLTNLGYEVITVDSNIAAGADFPSVESAIIGHEHFDTAHICTPNFTHEELARKVAPVSKIVFIEKPGLRTTQDWLRLIQDFPQTRFMMVKNNMWRNNIAELKALANEASTIKLNWINNDRVPSPGSWFTTKSLAFGGVSRDLMPHLLSLFIALDSDYTLANKLHADSKQSWQLDQLTNTDYGTVKEDGTYDVDDYSEIEFIHNGRKWQLIADWRSLKGDHRCIEFVKSNGDVTGFELGLCPEDAYQAMIVDAVANIDNYDFWIKQITYDAWIHDQIETL